MKSVMRRTIVVTGSSRGIGRAITDKLIGLGHLVIGIARDATIADYSDNKNYTPVNYDFIDLDNITPLMRDLFNKYPMIDGLISNVGYGDFGSLEQFSVKRVKQLIDVNLTSHIIMSQLFLPHLKTKGGGDICFIGSEAALQGAKNGSVYCASKFGLRGLAQSLRQEAQNRGVKIMIVHPGMVRTDFFQELFFAPGDDPANAVTPEEVADVIELMLTSQGAAVLDEVVINPQKKVVKFTR